MTHPCPLCQSASVLFYQNNNRIFFQCTCCRAIFLNEPQRLNPESEKSRYQKHNNDIEDKEYQNFVSPITSAIQRDFTEKNTGLDFGAGTGPVISKVLHDAGYQIKQYDPYFHNHRELLAQRYNFIACCEVMEHFYDPKKEFRLLKQLLLPKGKLYCMTEIYKEGLNFHDWYYKNDPTHVFLYTQETIHWIKKEFGFSDVKIEGRLITFSN